MATTSPQPSRLGRQNGKTPSQITYPEYQRIYKDVNGAVFPLEADAMQQVVDPRGVVANRRGRGGPQPAEVERMLAEHRNRLAADRTWVGTERQKMATAETRLNGVLDLSQASSRTAGRWGEMEAINVTGTRSWLCRHVCFR